MNTRHFRQITGWMLSMALVLSTVEGAGVSASAVSEESAEGYSVEFTDELFEFADGYAENAGQTDAGEASVSEEGQESAAQNASQSENGAGETGLIDAAAEAGSDGADLIEDVSGSLGGGTAAGDPSAAEPAVEGAGDVHTEGNGTDLSFQDGSCQDTAPGAEAVNPEGAEETGPGEDQDFLFSDEGEDIFEENLEWEEEISEQEEVRAEGTEDPDAVSETGELDPEGLIEEDLADGAETSDPVDWFDEDMQDSFEIDNPMVVNPDGTVSAGSPKRRLMAARPGRINTNYGDQLYAKAKSLYDSRVANYYERRGSANATENYTLTYKEANSIYTFTVDLSEAVSLRSTPEYQAAYSEIMGICQSAQDAFFYDYPQVFWTRSSVYSVSYDARIDETTKVATYWVKSLSFEPTEAFDDAFSYVSRLDTAVEEAANAIEAAADYDLDGETSDNEIVQRIHDYIAVRCTYATETLNQYISANKGYGSMTASERAAYLKTWRRIFTPAAVFFDFTDDIGPGIVCEGYARAFKILCDYFDIPCMCIGGLSRSNAEIGHMWNYVCVGGTWQLVDVTWDDNDDNLKYQYFLVDDLTTSGRLPSGNITDQNQKRTISDPEVPGASYTIPYSPQTFTLLPVHTDQNAYERSNTDQNAACIGYIEKTCSIYGSKYWVATGQAPLGHSPVVDDRVADCTHDWLTIREHCDRCGKALSERETATAPGHDFIQQQDGSMKCSRCGIEQVDVSGLRVAPIDAQARTGESVHPPVTVYDGDYRLTEGVHYTLAYGENINSGEGSFTITGMGIYAGEAVHTFDIAGELTNDNTELAFSFEGGAGTFDGTPREPACTVTYLGKVLDPRYYSVTFSDNIHAGNGAKAVVEGVEPYSGSASGSFEIAPANLKDVLVASNIKLTKSYYTGSPLTPKTTISYVDGSGKTVKMTEGVDYTLSWSENVNAGKGKFTVKGKNDFTGSFAALFNIYPRAVTFRMSPPPDVYYTGDDLTPEPAVWDNAAGDVQKDRDYTLTYTDNRLPGTVVVTATGIGNYKGSSGSTTFGILGTPVLVEAAAQSGIVYDGAAVEEGVDLHVHVYLYANGTKGEEITGDYTGTDGAPGLTFRYREKDAAETAFADGLPKDAGDYVIRVTAQEDTIRHRGSAFGECDLSIAPKGISFNVGSIPDQYYTGSDLTPEPAVWDTVAGDVQKDKDYSLTYTNNLIPGECAVTVTGIGNYEGSSGSTAFNILEVPVLVEAEAEALIGSDGAAVREGEDFQVHVYLAQNNTRGEEVTRDYTGTGEAPGLTYQYRSSDAPGTSFVDGLPAQIGSYVIRVTASKDTARYRLGGSAQFTLTIVQGYPVVWMNGSTVLETCEAHPEGTAPSFGGTVPVKASTAQYTYVFAGWAEEDGLERGTALADLPVVSEEATYYAAFSKIINRYPVRFMDGFGNTIKTQTVEYGSSATAPEVPPRSGYAFAGWDREYSGVTGPVTVTAKWQTDMTNAAVVLSGSEFTYNGRVQRPGIVSIGGKTLTEGKDYTAAWSNASSADAGAYTVTITGRGSCTGATRASYRILKAPNTLTVKGKTAKLKAGKLKTKAQTLSVGKVMTVGGAKGTLSYKLVSVKNSKYKKYFKVNAKTGKVTVKKGLKKGTYKLKVAVTAAGDGNYDSATAAVTCTIKVTK